MTQHIKDIHIIGAIAFMALYQSSASVLTFAANIVALTLIVAIIAAWRVLWRYKWPNRRGCGTPVEHGAQWRVYCGEKGMQGVALCKACDPRHGLEIKR